MIINTVGTLNLSTKFGALFVFSAFIETLDFFSSRNTSSVLHVECNAFLDCLCFTPSLHHVYQRKTPQ
jgi:hypothetical protein